MILHSKSIDKSVKCPLKIPYGAVFKTKCLSSKLLSQKEAR